MFTVEERDRVRARVLELAHADPRIVAGAEVGALSQEGGDRWRVLRNEKTRRDDAFAETSAPRSEGDRWSDLDLTFGVAEGAAVDTVLADWTERITGELDAAHLFDLPFRTSIYRVFLLPGNLQLDVSFTPEREFGALGPKFTLLFGSAVERDPVPPPSAQHLFGFGAHHAVRARICVERGRMWQAEYWISGLRDQALSLACLRLGLEVPYGRGFDQLPAETLARAGDALVRSPDRGDLLRALAAAIELLLQEADAVPESSKVAAGLRDLTAQSSPSQ